MSKLYGLLSILSIATVLATGSFCAYLVFEGKLNGERVEKIAAVLRGELDMAAASQPTSAPASQPMEEETHVRRSAEELKAHKREERLQRAILDRAAADTKAQRDLLNQALQELVQREEKLQSEKTAWDDQRKKMTEQAQDAGFEKELALVSKLPAKQAKEHLLLTWQQQKADAVRLLNALKPSTAQAILKELKTPEEAAVLHELLEQLRLSNSKDADVGSGKTESP